MKQKAKKPQRFNEGGSIASSDRNDSGVNGARTGAKSDANLTPARSPDVPIIGGLRKVRRAHGYDSLIGCHCACLAEKLENFAKATDHVRRERLQKSIVRTATTLAELTAMAG